MTRRGTGKIGLTIFLVFFILGTLWNIAQPVFSGQDEIQHLNMGQAVWSGQFIPPLTVDGAQFESGLIKVRSPGAGSVCYVADPTVSATCDKTSYRGGEPNTTVIDYTSREPLLASVLTGLPSALDAGKLGLYLSRELNVVIGAGGLAAALALALSRRRPLLALGVLLGTTPAAVAEFGTLGASQLEVAAISVLWVAVALLLDGEEPTAPFMTLTAASVVVLTLSRPISWVFAGLAGVVLLVGSGRDRLRVLARSWPVRVAVAVAVLAVLGAVAWYLLVTAPVNPHWLQLAHAPKVTALGARISIPLGATQGYWVQSIAGIGFGYYAGPWWMVLGWTMLIGGVTVAGWLFSSSRRRIALTIVIATLLALPIVSQAVTLPRTYLFWQGRYDIPELIGVLVLAASALDGRLRQIPELGRLATGAVLGVGFLEMLSFYGALRRYAVGVNATFNPLRWANGWRPPLIGAVPVLVAGLASIALAYGVVWYWQRSALSDLLSPDPVSVPLSGRDDEDAALPEAAGP